MNDAPYLALTLIFTAAGIVKGITGMGLPTVAVALLGLLTPLPSAAALLIVPSLLTNLNQLFTGPPLSDALRRLAPMMLCIAAATLAASGLLLSNPQWSACALGAVLVIYALTALFAPAVQVSPPAERWLSPLAGALTGLITGATGVFVLPPSLICKPSVWIRRGWYRPWGFRLPCRRWRCGRDSGCTTAGRWGYWLRPSGRRCRR